jgi:hypothetical protein
LVVNSSTATVTGIFDIFTGTGIGAPSVNTPVKAISMASIFAAANKPMIGGGLVGPVIIRGGLPQAPWNTGFSKGDIFKCGINTAFTITGIGTSQIPNSIAVLKLAVTYTGT